MASLPPYSTYRTDNKQMMYPQAISHGNVLTFTPPGFKQTLNIKFPDCRLAVCEKCKKNYKTRDMCRVRNAHTAKPWTTAYICITLDDTCTDTEGHYIEKPLTVRMVQWQPFQVKNTFHSKTPVCSACKKTNRTRSFCRERHKHRQLPWCTVYVLLSALDSTDPSTVVAAPSKLLGGEAEVDTDGGKGGEETETTDVNEVLKPVSGPEETQEEEAAIGIPNSEEEAEVKSAPVPESSDNPTPTDGSPVDEQEKVEGTKVPKPPKQIKTGEDSDGEDIAEIAESRTFLVKVSCRSTSVHWLELAEYDSTDTTIHSLVAPDSHMQQMAMQRSAPLGLPAPKMDPSQAQYYANQMGYPHGGAAQQHQHALKSHQQYFFQMQQRQNQHYVAQAAWQAQYNNVPGMPPQSGQPQPAPQPGVPLPSVQPHVPGTAPSDPQGVASPSPGHPTPAPVTAGEAAAQQQQQQQQQQQHQHQQYHMQQPGQQSQMQHPPAHQQPGQPQMQQPPPLQPPSEQMQPQVMQPPPPMQQQMQQQQVQVSVPGQEQATPVASAEAPQQWQQQPPPHQQWHQQEQDAHMMYPQQMYQQQPPQQMGDLSQHGDQPPPHSQEGVAPHHAQHQSHSAMEQHQQQPPPPSIEQEQQKTTAAPDHQQYGLAQLPVMAPEEPVPIENEITATNGIAMKVGDLPEPAPVHSIPEQVKMEEHASKRVRLV